jgi:hypothetical protein
VNENMFQVVDEVKITERSIKIRVAEKIHSFEEKKCFVSFLYLIFVIFLFARRTD